MLANTHEGRPNTPSLLSPSSLLLGETQQRLAAPTSLHSVHYPFHPPPQLSTIPPQPSFTPTPVPMPPFPSPRRFDCLRNMSKLIFTIDSSPFCSLVTLHPAGVCPDIRQHRGPNPFPFSLQALPSTSHHASFALETECDNFQVSTFLRNTVSGIN